MNCCFGLQTASPGLSKGTPPYPAPAHSLIVNTIDTWLTVHGRRIDEQPWE